ncbi:MAG: T9SS type A sorting domain-containing protein, partial [Parachlamydiaceae bacterium]|nr:T9SS type A sorting domain-containing protein [Parachlamydiaceae bacterium]
TFNLIGSNSCDSLVTLDLTINTVSDITTTTSGTTITANNNNALYQWLDCANGFSIISGETEMSFTPQAGGAYAVELTENSCQDTSVCVSIMLVGANETNFSNSFIIFPNPANEQIFIQNPKKNQGEIQIFDTSGKSLIRENLYDFLTAINIEALNQGAFYLKITSDKDFIIKKIIKY